MPHLDRAAPAADHRQARGGGEDTTDGLAGLAADLSTERLARGTRMNLAGIALERVFGVALFVTLPLLLRPGQLGAYYEVMAVLTLAVTLGVLGLDVGIVRFTALASQAGDFARIRAYVRAGSIVAGGCSVALAMGLWLLAPALGKLFHVPTFAQALRVGVPAIPFLVWAFLLVAVGRGLKVMWPTVAAIQVAQPAGQLVATLALAAAGYRLFGAVGAFSLSAFGAWVAALAALRRIRIPKPMPAGPARPGGAVTSWGHAVAPLVRFSALVSGMTLMGTMLLWVDTLLLGAYRPASEVAVYGVVVRLLALSTAVALTVAQIFGPFVTQLAARGDRDRLRTMLHTATRWSVLLAAPVVALLAILGGVVLPLFRQPAGHGGAAIVVLAGGFALEAATGPATQLLTMSGRPGWNVANSAVAAVLNVALNLALIPPFGLMGAATSWSIVMAALAVARLLEVRLIHGFAPLGWTLWKPALALGMATGAAAIVLHATRASGAGSWPALAITAGAFAGVLALALLATGIEGDDRTLVRTLVGRGRRRGDPP